MRKALAFVVMVLVIMVIAVSCEEPHTHTFSDEWTSDATHHWHKATCGHEDVNGKEVHEWGDWVTETGKATRRRVCSICNRTEISDIPDTIHVHTLSSYKWDSSRHWKVCTSRKEQIYSSSHSFLYKDAGAEGHFQKCSVCGYTADTEKHVYTDKKVLKDNDIYKVCDKCGDDSVEKVEVKKDETTGIETAATTEKISNETYEKKEVTYKDENGKEVTQKLQVNTAPINITVVASSGTEEVAEVNKTVVSFPIGALKADSKAESVSLIVEKVPAATASSIDSGYQVKKENSEEVNTDVAIVAGLEFNLSGAVASDLAGTEKENDSTENKGTTITTYITKGLGNYDAEKENIKIEYLGTTKGKAPEIVSYNSGTGELVFKVYHFSKYSVVSTEAVIVDITTNTAYKTLKEAFEAAGVIASANYNTGTVESDGRFVLLKDVELKEGLTLIKNVDLDLNSHLLDMNNFSLTTMGYSVPGPDVKIKNGKITGKSVNTENTQQSGQYFYIFQGTLTLDGVTSSDWTGFNCFVINTNAKLTLSESEIVFKGQVGIQASSNSVIIIKNSELSTIYDEKEIYSLDVSKGGDAVISNSDVILKTGNEDSEIRNLTKDSKSYVAGYNGLMIALSGTDDFELLKDRITMGTIPSSAKHGGQAVEWRVLEIDTENRRALVISEKVLEKKGLNNTDKDYSWTGSDIKTFLNGDFLTSYGLNGVSIASVTLETEKLGDFNEKETSQEKVFLLSLSEALPLGASADCGGVTISGTKDYFGNWADNETEAEDLDGNKVGWWLRTPSYTESYKNYGYAMINYGSGSPYGWQIWTANSTSYNDQADIGIRPAFWLEAKK